jgi:hypothetical protein
MNLISREAMSEPETLSVPVITAISPRLIIRSTNEMSVLQLFETHFLKNGRVASVSLHFRIQSIHHISIAYISRS